MQFTPLRRTTNVVAKTNIPLRNAIILKKKFSFLFYFMKVIYKEQIFQKGIKMVEFTKKIEIKIMPIRQEN